MFTISFTIISESTGTLCVPGQVAQHLDVIYFDADANTRPGTSELSCYLLILVRRLDKSQPIEYCGAVLMHIMCTTEARFFKVVFAS